MNFDSFRIIRGPVAAALLIGGLLCTTGGSGPRALTSGEGPPFVCAEVVVAIDASDSTRTGGFRRQISALDVAFRHAALHRAIQDCLPGSIALSMYTWSGPLEQHPCLPWTLIRNDSESALSAFALPACRYIGGTTDIGAALEHGLRLLAKSPFDSHYRAILLLTNGRTDRGTEVRLEAARRKADWIGISLVGHALLRRDRMSDNRREQQRSSDYVARTVSGGPRSFMSASTRATDMPVILDTLIRMLRQELH